MGIPKGIQGYAMQMIRNNPQIAQNPNAQQMIAAIEQGDEASGIQFANNILNTHGLSKEQGITIALQRLKFPQFGGR